MTELREARPANAGSGGLVKCATGIAGLDEITFGGLPSRRTTLVFGGPGTGKTALGLSLLAHGCELGEPGILVLTEQGHDEIVSDAASLGHDLAALEGSNRLAIVPVDLLKTDTVEAGDYTLDGFLAMVERAADRIGARRLVIDGVDGFFASLDDERILRTEFHRLSRRFAERGLTTVITGMARGAAHRLEEYLSDCVVVLDQRVTEQVSTRRLRIVKYRGSAHGTNEYPFAVTPTGLMVFPITSAALAYEASDEMLPTGIATLDQMLGGRGVYRGSAVLIAGRAGTGKTTLASHLAASVCAGGGRCAYYSFEESPSQIERNLRSVGLDLHEMTANGRLALRSARPSVQGLEEHLGQLHRLTVDEPPDLVVMDPITNFISVGPGTDVKAMLTRLLDGFKTSQITIVLTSLILSGDATLGAEIGISSLMDTIVLLEQETVARRRRRLVSIVKSRGMANSQDIQELVFSGDGLRIEPLGPSAGTGSET